MKMRMNMKPSDPLYNRHASRDRLHKKHMDGPDGFLEWVQTKGYKVLPKPPAAAYEVGRIEKFDPLGNNPHFVFYAKADPTQHVTVPYGAVDLISDYYTWRKQNELTRERNK